VDALTHMGLIVAIGGHADTALETIDKALAIDPKYPPAYLYRARCSSSRSRTMRGR
jgi:Tfp pilus assembly protein PilF